MALRNNRQYILTTEYKFNLQKCVHVNFDKIEYSD